MRLIDADALAEFLKDAVKRQKYDDLNIDGLLTVADVIEAIISELNGTSLNGFKNAPTIELRCENCEAFNKTRLLIPQPERKTGRWILSDTQWQEDVDNGNYQFICSEYGKADIHSKAVVVSFCWNCGARMEDKG